MRQPTPEELNQACMNYRHDYGILPEEERQQVALIAQNWLEAWIKVVDPSIVIPQVTHITETESKDA